MSTGRVSYEVASVIPPSLDPGRVGPTWDPDGPPNPSIPYGIHGGLVGYVAASRRLSRGVGAAPGEPRAEANYDFLISTPRETRVEREHGHIWTV